MGDFCAFEGAPAPVVIVGAECNCSGGFVASKVCHTVQTALNRARRWVPGRSLPDDFAFDAVFLRSEGEGHMICCDECR